MVPMCGRYSLFANKEDIAERLGFDVLVDFEWEERYNVAPSQEVMAIVGSDKGNRVGTLRWGLVPSWAADPKIGYKMINARMETVDQKPSFKRLLSRRRCIIPADGFYEWKRNGKEKQPYRFQLKSKEVFGFAGLWDRWQQGDQTIQSCTIITTEANDVVKDIHDRMPVILTQESEQIWLDRSIEDSELLKTQLVSYPADEMELYPISSLVNSPKNDRREIINSI